jgi:hypothetical protein
LKHLGLWEAQKRPQSKINSPPLEYCAAEQFPSYMDTLFASALKNFHQFDSAFAQGKMSAQ